MAALFASISIHQCPQCGEPVPVMGINAGEPALYQADCKSCGAELQLREDSTTGKLKIEMRRKPS